MRPPVIKILPYVALLAAAIGAALASAFDFMSRDGHYAHWEQEAMPVPFISRRAAWRK